MPSLASLDQDKVGGSIAIEDNHPTAAAKELHRLAMPPGGIDVANAHMGVGLIERAQIAEAIPQLLFGLSYNKGIGIGMFHHIQRRVRIHRWHSKFPENESNSIRVAGVRVRHNPAAQEEDRQQ